MSVGSGGGGGELTPYGAAKTSVWWDIENCQVPRGSDAHAIAQNISSALADVGYKGAVTISAYGDTNKIPTAVQQALSSTGIALNHVPAGVKDASDKKILVDMLFWAVDNPPPANYLLISGDRDFSNALHQLRMRRYNILLSHAPNVSQALVAAARGVWSWASLVCGGPPRQNSDSCYLVNASGGNSSCSEAGKKTIGDSIPFNGSSSTRNEDTSIGRGDNCFTGNKQAWRNQALATEDISRSSSLPESKEGTGIQFQKQMSMPVISSSEAHESTYTTVSSSSCLSTQMTNNQFSFSSQSEGKHFSKAPHEFFGANKPKALVGSSNQPPHPVGPITNGNNISNNQQTQHYQPLRPTGVPPPLQNYSSNSHNYGSYSPLYQQSFMPFRPGPPPDFNRPKISEFPSNSYQNGSFPPQNSRPPGYMQNPQPSYYEKAYGPQLNAMNSSMSYNGNWGIPGCQMSSTAVPDLIGNIQGALNGLKANKMTPTEANISDCVRYGMGIQNFNVKMALNCALENNVVVMHKLGANLPFYIGKNDRLWGCVNPLDSNVSHPEATWDAIKSFLSSPHGQRAISSTECRYHAATVLKKACLEHLALGEILQILHVIVQVKKWIIPCPHGWQPLSFTLKVATDNAGVGIKQQS